eukprot:COSAG01_NODE_3565_length_5926_cov_13.053029_3_plen_379_part_00
MLLLKNVDALGDAFSSTTVDGGGSGGGGGRGSGGGRRGGRGGGGGFGGGGGGGQTEGISFPTLLNVLDGAVGNTNGLLMMLTTCDIERLKRVLEATKSTALLRAGRVSVQVPFFRPSMVQVAGFYRFLFGDSAADSGTTGTGGGAMQLEEACRQFCEALPSEFAVHEEGVSSQPTKVAPADEGGDGSSSSSSPSPPSAPVSAPASRIRRSTLSFLELKGYLMQAPILADSHRSADASLLRDFLEKLQEGRQRELCRATESLCATARRVLQLDPAKTESDNQSKRMLVAADCLEVMRELRRLRPGSEGVAAADEDALLVERSANQLEDLAARLEGGEVCASRVPCSAAPVWTDISLGEGTYWYPVAEASPAPESGQRFC